MTAEVAILTKTAVAVAADSAVTVGGTKVHRSTTKIFAVSTDIGAMIYGHSELAGLPWEVLLKLFRTEHRNETFPTVDACYEAIHRFLSQPRFRIETGSMESLARFGIEVFEYVRDRLENVEKTERTEKFVESIIDSEIRSYDDGGSATFEAPPFEEFLASTAADVSVIATDVLLDVEYEVPESLVPKFAELIYTALISSYGSEYQTGLVVFGFGNDELFPQMRRVVFDTVPLDRLRIISSSATGVTNLEASSWIVPLANREIMDTLIQGIDDHLQDVYVECASAIANEVANRIISDNLHADDQIVAKEISKREIEKIVKEYREGVADYVFQRNVRGMMNTLDNMPKEDIAVLAEALVEVTALRIKASEVVESVAGPVDVCVITKGDGLIWIKRKHYFDLSKNLQYLHRRYGIVAATSLGEADERD
jgi:hypothetical protein